MVGQQVESVVRQMSSRMDIWESSDTQNDTRWFFREYVTSIQPEWWNWQTRQTQKQQMAAGAKNLSAIQNYSFLRTWYIYP